VAKKGRARKKRRGAGGGPDLPGPLATGVAIVTLRLWTGVFFLVTAWWKLIEPGFSVGEKIEAFRGQYAQFIDTVVAHPPEVLGVTLHFYADFLGNVMRPNIAFAAPAILAFEALLGLGLVLGFGVRLLASLGFLLMLVFSLGKPQPGAAFPLEEPVGVFLFTVKSANWPVTLILLALALLAAGRILGLDAKIRAGAPGWLRWIA